MRTGDMRYLTIRQTAARGPLPERLLRQWEKQGKLPGVRSGNRFLVNYSLLLELLEAESRHNCKGGTNENQDH